MKFKLNIPILTLFILTMLVGYHSPLPTSAQAISTRVKAAETDLVEPLKIAPASVTIIGPTSGTVNTSYFFSAQVTPDNVTQPFTHYWQADGQEPIVQEGGGIDAVRYSWDQPGTYTITLNTSNNDGSASTVHEVTIAEPSTQFLIEFVDIGGGRGTPRLLDDGTVLITFPEFFVEDIIIGLNLFCTDGTAPIDASLDMITDNTTINLPMSNNAASPTAYDISIARFEVPLENSTLSVRAVCSSTNEGSSTTEHIRVGAIRFYGSMGRVTDAITGQPIAGAEVTLHHVPGWSPRTGPDDSRPNTCESNLSKEAGAAWSQPAPIGQGIVVDPENTIVTPPTSSRSTNDDGFYGWDILEGCWYIQVAADGYQPITSPVVGVPPAVRDLDLVLRPTMSARITPSRITMQTGGSVGADLHLFNGGSTPIVINLRASSDSVQDLPATVTLEANSEQVVPFTIIVASRPGTVRHSVIATAQDDPAIRAEALVFVEGPISDIRFSGQALLERRGENNHSGVLVCVDTICTTTDDEGLYTLDSVPETGTVTVIHPGYLFDSYRYNFGEGGPSPIPVVTLLAGDLDASGTIDIDDAVLMGLAWSSSPGDAHWNAAADITDDGIVDQRDMDAILFNWGETAQ